MHGRSVVLFASAAALALVGLAFWMLRDGPRPLEERSNASARAVAPAAVEPTEDVDAGAVVRTAEVAPAPRRPPRTLRGVVVDASQLPVAGARIETAGTGRAPAAATSGRDGGFRLQIDATDARGGVALLGTGPDGALGIVRVPWFEPVRANGFAPVSDAIPTLVLVAPGAVDVDVVEGGDPPGAAAGVEVSAEMIVDGEFVPVASGTTDARGRATLRLPRGDAAITARRVGRSVARATLTIESGGRRGVTLPLRSTRELTVRVTSKETHAPIAGARVELLDRSRNLHEGGPLSPRAGLSWLVGRTLLAVPSDSTGIATLRDVDPIVGATISVSADGYASDTVLATDTRTPIPVELRPREVTTLRWKLAEGNVPIPADGTTVTVRCRVTTSSMGALGRARIEHGELCVERTGSGFFSALASTPAHEIAAISTSLDGQPNSTARFDAACRLVVALRLPDGRPARDATVQISESGDPDLSPPATTDEHGEATFDELRIGTVRIHASAVDWLPSPPTVGEIALREVENRFEAVVAPANEAILALTLDGAPGLPPLPKVSSSSAKVHVAGEEPGKGELTLELSADPAADHVPLDVAAAGFLPAQVDVPLVRGGPPPRVEVELTRGATIVARVLTRDDARVEIVAERSDQDGRFVPVLVPDSYRPGGAAPARVFSSLRPGTWRLRDARTGTASAPVALQAGDTAEVTLDVEVTLHVRGRVRVPEGTSFDDVRVLLGATDGIAVRANGRTNTQWPGIAVGSDGAFEATLSAHDPWVRAWHPRLVSAEPAPVRVASDDAWVELELSTGPTLRFRAQLPTGATLQHGTVAVWFLDPGGRPANSRVALLGEDGAILCDPPVGTCTLLLDAGGAEAPLLLENVTIGARGCDLGELRFTAGSTVHLDAGAGEPAKDVHYTVTATRCDSPPLLRAGYASAGEPIAVGGLARGRHEIRLEKSAPSGTVELWKGVVDVDGERDVTLPVELK